MTAPGAIAAAVRNCLARHRGLSAASIAWVLVPDLREFCEGLTGDSIGNYPHDPDDFVRCRRLLALIPDGAARLGEVAEAFPGTKWPALVSCWPELESLYLQEENNASGNAPRLYARICKANGVRR